jgi:hypothetical protein
MPGTPHEVVLLAIRDNPALFAEILRRVVGIDMPGPIEVIDSNIRFAASLETRPDLVVRTPSAPSKWTIIELQIERMNASAGAGRWPSAFSCSATAWGMSS